MPMLGIYGDVGSGKNTISTIDDYCTNSKYPDIPIYSNFKLNLKNAEMIEPEEVFEVFEVDKAIPIKILITDEAYGWYENRNSGNKDSNQFFSYLMFQSRKVGLYWKSIAQLRGTLDLRWRGMENLVIECANRNLDMAGNSYDDFHFGIAKRFGDGIRIRRLKLKYKKAIPYFKLYNTREKILPQDFKNMELRMRNKNSDNLNAYIDSVTLELYNNRLSEIPVKYLKTGEIKYLVTQERVRDILLRMGKEPEYSSSVKVRLEELILKNITNIKQPLKIDIQDIPEDLKNGDNLNA